MRSMTNKFLGALFLALCLGCATFSQNVTGTIAGTVTDSKGGAVANAMVTVKNADRNEVIRSVNTDAYGGYVALLLPIGHYTVSVEIAGFKKATVTGLSLNVNDKLTVNLTLEVGAVSESVTVEASAAEVELQSATPAGLITGTQIRELALGTRNYEQLVSMMPGVSIGTLNQLYVGNSLPSGLAAVVSFSVNGQRNSANNWTIDGVDNVDRGSNLTLSNFPSVDALAEFKVLRSLYDAEFGRAGGGQINVVTKSGTNSFHGNAYEFFRSDVLSANNFFNNRNGIKRPPLRYNNFGYTFGGPVLKSKTFFFFSEEFRRVITYTTFSATSPTAALLAGNFTNPVCTAVSNGQCTAVGQSIAQANFNSAATAYINDIWSKMPAPNPNTLIQSNNLVTAQRSIFNFREELVRIDHTFGPKLSVFGRYSHDSIPTAEPGGLFTGAALPGVANTSTNSPGWQATGHFNYTISPRWLNDGGYAFNYSAIISDPVGFDAKANSPDVASAVTLPFAVTLSRNPDLSISGFSGITSFGQYRDYNRDHNVFDNMSWLKGRHSFRFGVSYHHYNKNENAGGTNTGSFSVVTAQPAMATGVTAPPSCTTAPAPGTTTAQCNLERAWSNFLNGFTNFSQVAKDLTADIIMQQWEGYAQDEFRVRSGLTVTLGVRYSFFGVPTDGFGNLNNFNPSLWDSAKAPTVSPNGLLCLVGTPASTFCPGGGTPNPNADLLNGFIVGGKNSPFGSHISNQDSKNFAPRLGIAWDPFGDGKTSVRTGFGLFYDAVAVGNYENTIYNNPPIVNSVNINGTQLQNPGVVAANLSVVPKGNTFYVMPVPYSTPYTQQWSLDIQRQLWKNTLVDIGYFGNNAHHLSGLLDINQPVPGAAAAAGLTCGNPFGTPCTGTQNTIVTTSAQGQSLNAVRPFQGYGPMRALETEFNSNYHALQASIQKHWGTNILQLNYTWSHNLTNNPSDRSNAPQNPYDLNAEYGPSALDRRHNFTASYVYDLPWYKAQEGALGHALGGWEVSGLWYFFTGSPLTVTEGTQDPGGIGCLISSPVSCRPDITGNPNSGAQHIRSPFFVTSVFQQVPNGEARVGSSGRGVLTGPRFQRWDFALFKNTKIYGERMSLQFRAEAINLFNHTNWNAVSTSLTASTFGQVTSANDARIMQLGLKLNF
jgi:carboxypeptidase family protein